MKRTGAWASGALLLAVVAGGPLGECGMKEPAMLRIVALGDSTTNCAGKSKVTEATAWRTLLARELSQRLGKPVEVVNAGVDADVAPLALARLDRGVLAHRPDWVIVMLGTNDAGYFRPPNGVADTPRVPLGEFGAAMREILRRVRGAGAGVVLCTSVPMGASYWLAHLPDYKANGLNHLVARYAEITRQLARQFDLPLADVYAAFDRHPDRDAMIPDGIHPDVRGMRLIADTLLPVLEGVVKNP